jgi:hypothetical protein
MEIIFKFHKKQGELFLGSFSSNYLLSYVLTYLLTYISSRNCTYDLHWCRDGAKKYIIRPARTFNLFKISIIANYALKSVRACCACFYRYRPLLSFLMTTYVILTTSLNRTFFRSSSNLLGISVSNSMVGAKKRFSLEFTFCITKKMRLHYRGDFI